MFLKQLIIQKGTEIIRDILFKKGTNLIIDNTSTPNRQDTGNSIGKTTVLRLIDFCLGTDGKNIYTDTEFKNNSNNTIVENFLKVNNITIKLILVRDIENESSQQIIIAKNFNSRKDKIQEINDETYNDRDFDSKLKELCFNSTLNKPTFRQIISKNIRYEKNRLANTIKVLHNSVTFEEYEALYLFWLGIESDNLARKQQLHELQSIEEKLQSRLIKENDLQQIENALYIVDLDIKKLNKKKESFNLNENFNDDLNTLNNLKSKINKLTTEINRLEFRRTLISESKSELENDFVNINANQIKLLYQNAKRLISDIQVSFEQTLDFHNNMLSEKIKFVTQELPNVENELNKQKKQLNLYLSEEKQLSEKLYKTGAIDELQDLITELNKQHEKKGSLEEQKRLWVSSNSKLDQIKDELDLINQSIIDKETIINNRILKFNEFFAEISMKLYNERFILSQSKNDRAYSLNIKSIEGNLGTGKKKGQIAAFDFAHIQFCDEIEFPCLHFILHDQNENIHDNQIKTLIEIANEINCQYIFPILRDKLPSDIDVSQYEILSLSQTDKLFKIE